MDERAPAPACLQVEHLGDGPDAERGEADARGLIRPVVERGTSEAGRAGGAFRHVQLVSTRTSGNELGTAAPACQR